ncbi:hypothetical protein [Methylorubrum extorquens]|uniref:hypothetical protein n=1 Tax=Methylorubrum extorquens TaxID=408 RepID=UPI0020A1C220|nr:hypothetical protein [Methylorubrum extorquens]MCP1539022.1 hypothetical protein [Methylorubrum extorquens]
MTDPDAAAGRLMTDAKRPAAEMHGLLGFARGLGLEEATVRKIYEVVLREASAAGASDDRMGEVRKRMLVGAQDATAACATCSWSALSDQKL